MGVHLRPCRQNRSELMGIWTGNKREITASMLSATWLFWWHLASFFSFSARNQICPRIKSVPSASQAKKKEKSTAKPTQVAINLAAAYIFPAVGWRLNCECMIKNSTYTRLSLAGITADCALVEETTFVNKFTGRLWARASFQMYSYRRNKQPKDTRHGKKKNRALTESRCLLEAN